MKDLFPETLELISLHKAKELIIESRAGFLKLFNSSPSCMSITTMEDRTFVKANKQFFDKFEFTEAEVIGHTSVEIGILDEQESIKVAALLKEHGRLNNDMVICRTKSGKEIHTISSIEKMEIDGEIYFLSSFLDLTKFVEQQRIIEKQNKEILESINYARLIQNSILPTQKQIENILPESFVLSIPKNIVSGDFYWIKKIGNKILVAACDCTGHGVPGALISIVGFKLLSKYVGEYSFFKPAEILNQINVEFALAKNRSGSKLYEMRDGMDLSLCAIDKVKMTMEYAGAYNPIYLVRKGELMQLTVDKIPINFFTNHSGEQFNNYELKIEKGDALYLFSDGYADQFGGPDGKKFRYKNFRELILSVHQLPMHEQRTIFLKTIQEWKDLSENEQTDDILVVGFRI